MKHLSNIMHLWWPPIAWMTIIFFFSSRTSVHVADEYMVNFLFFKLLHIIEYFILYILTVRAIRSKRAAFIITILYAISDEIHQTFVPTREGKPRDVIIDAIGAALAWMFIVNILPKTPKKLRKLAAQLQILF